jgi:ATP-dependent phosphoenolpyruvate carboxykinase
MEHQSSEQVVLTHADRPPTRPDGPRPGSQYCSDLSSEQSVVQIPKTTQLLSKPNLAPADLRTVRPSRPAGPHYNSGTVPRAASSGQDHGRSSPKAWTVRSTNEQDLSEVNRLQTPLEDRGWSALKARTVRAAQELALFKHAFERIFNS